MTSDQGQKVIINGWKLSGTNEAKKIGLSELPSLDLFKGITMDEGNVDFVINQSFPGKEDPHVADSKLDDDNEESE